MDRYTESFETWNKYASLYQDKFMDLDIYNETYDFFCNALPQNNPSVLELGCGPGNITKYLLLKRPDFNITGIDIAPNMIELAKSNNPAANFAVMDIRQINELHAKFDGIICGFCFPYLSEPESSKLIADCRDLLKNDGVLYLSFVEGNQNNSDFVTVSGSDRIYFYYHDADKLTVFLKDNNFENPKRFDVNYNRAGGQTEIHTIIITKLTKQNHEN